MQAAVSRPRLISTLSWILYDLANTAYSMNVVSLYFGTWVIIHLGQPDLVVSLANSISMALVALTLPVLGDWSDCKGKKLFSLFVFTMVCILATAMLGGWDVLLSKLVYSPLSNPAAIWSNKPLILGVFIVLTFILANYAYQGGLVFYNALLPAVSTPRTLGRVSGYGVAIGYLGSIIGLLVAQVFVEGEILGFNISGMEKQGPAAAFLPTALLFLVFAIPVFFFVPEPPLRPENRRSWNLKQSYRRVFQSLRDTHKYPGLLRFLLAKFLYEDSIQTVIIFMGVYTQKVMGFSLAQANKFFIVTIPSAVIGSALCGILTDHYGPKKTLQAVIALWVVSLILVILNPWPAVFWVLGTVVGALLGSTWTAARPLLISLVPREMLGEFFGLYALSGKVAAISGPLIWSAVTLSLSRFPVVIQYKSAIAVLAGIMGIGLWLLRRVPDHHDRFRHDSELSRFDTPSQN